MTMPNFLIIGAARAGTTALYYYLKQHPQIYMSPVKEPRFFAFEGEKLNARGPGQELLSKPVTDIKAYRTLFRDASNETAIGEASPLYLYSPKAPERIRHYIPAARLIAVLRNPVQRAYSHFLHNVRHGIEPLADFAQALEAEEIRVRNNWRGHWHHKQQGLYYVQLKRYFDTFDRAQIRCYLHEDLKVDPTGLLQDVFEFLGVDVTFVPDVSFRPNMSGLPRHKTLHWFLTRLNRIKPIVKPLLPHELRQWIVATHTNLQNRNLVKPLLPLEMQRRLIQTHYKDDILNLQNLIQRDLSIWLE